MSKDLINKILEEIGLESIHTETEEQQTEEQRLNKCSDSKTCSKNGRIIIFWAKGIIYC